MYIAVDQAEPAWRAKDQFIFEEVQSSFNIDCLENSHPIHLPVEHPDDINQIFDRVTYGKGSSIIRMMSHFLTEATFRSGLKNYLSALQFGNADQDDLWDFLTAAAHRDRTLPEWMTVKMIMDTWTLKMGYPVLHVVRSGDGTSATITQVHDYLSFLRRINNLSCSGT
nr:uncharacterized protein LOC128695534 [Cherax quadricarinatus]